VLRLGCRERAPCALLRIEGQRYRTFEESSLRGVAAARPRSPGRALEIGCDAFVWTESCLSRVPGASIRIVCGVGCDGERPVRITFLFGGRRLIHRRTQERVSEVDVRSYRKQACRFCGTCGVGRNPELGGCAPEQGRIPEWLRGCDEDELLRLGWK